MKRASVAVGVSVGLLGSVLVSAPARAANEVSAPLAGDVPAAQQVAAFWLGDGGANLKNATPYNVQTVVSGERVPAASTASTASTASVADGVPGSVPASDDPKTSGASSLDVSLPATTGKVFFVGADGQPHWCSGTSVQSTYRNLVATAGHCVYDTQSNATTLDKWVFVPGYSEGTTPWGLYVGKQAFTHYDFDRYRDYNRDYAFVNVYNGVLSSPSGGLTDSGRLGDNVAGQGLTWNQKLSASAHVFGYPAGPHLDGTRPYTGQTLEWSSGQRFAMRFADFHADQAIGVDSPFTGEGSLGSSWVLRYSNDSRLGYLNGITISVSDTDGDKRYDTSVSPYFDGETYGVYSAATKIWSGSIV